jgi:hypothetical protein
VRQLLAADDPGPRSRRGRHAAIQAAPAPPEERPHRQGPC